MSAKKCAATLDVPTRYSLSEKSKTRGDEWCRISRKLGIKAAWAFVPEVHISRVQPLPAVDERVFSDDNYFSRTLSRCTSELYNSIHVYSNTALIALRYQWNWKLFPSIKVSGTSKNMFSMVRNFVPIANNDVSFDTTLIFVVSLLKSLHIFISWPECAILFGSCSMDLAIFQTKVASLQVDTWLVDRSTTYHLADRSHRWRQFFRVFAETDQLKLTKKIQPPVKPQVFKVFLRPFLNMT